MRRLINFTPLVVLFLAAYVEFSNRVMSRWFWLVLALLATAFAGFKLVCLIPNNSTEFSTARPWWAVVMEAVLFLFGASVTFVMWSMFAMA